MLLGLLVLANIGLGLILSLLVDPVAEETPALPVVAVPAPEVRPQVEAQTASAGAPVVAAAVDGQSKTTEVMQTAAAADRTAAANESSGSPVQPEQPQTLAAASEPARSGGPDAAELPARECRVWGPEQTPDAFAALQSELRAQGSFPEVKATDIQAAADYLVLVDKLGSRDNAKRVRQELNSMDIDTYMMTRDDGSMVISVGVFSRQGLARRQLQKVSDMGYSAQVEQLQRSQTVYNLSAHVAVDSPLYATSISSCLNIAQGG